jgi:hypothetical protein
VRLGAIRGAMMSPCWSETDHRQHRILDALFKAAERQGLKVKEEVPRRLFFEGYGEKFVFKLREKTRRVLRLPTDEERRREAAGLIKPNMEATGVLVFAIEPFLPSPLQCVWTETPGQPMEDMVGNILKTLHLAGSMLAQRRRDSEKYDRHQREVEHRRRQEAERQREDDNRWRHFVDLAERCRQADDARRFLAALEQHPGKAGTLVDGKTVSHWLVWAWGRLAAFDPSMSDPGAVFDEISKITASTYRD